MVEGGACSIARGSCKRAARAHSAKAVAEDCGANGGQPRRQRCSTGAACHGHVRHTDTQTRTQTHTLTHTHAYTRTYPHEVCSANGSQPRRQRCSASTACHCGTQTLRHARRLALSHTRMHTRSHTH